MLKPFSKMDKGFCENRTCLEGDIKLTVLIEPKKRKVKLISECLGIYKKDGLVQYMAAPYSQKVTFHL
jgi:hypothetical protein